VRTGYQRIADTFFGAIKTLLASQNDALATWIVSGGPDC
jgi:hypothetical protein